MCLDVSIPNTGIGTIRKVAHFYRPRTDTHEEHTVFLVLCIEFGDNDVHGSLGGSIQGTILDLEVVDEIEVGMTTGDGNDLLDLALHD